MLNASANRRSGSHVTFAFTGSSLAFTPGLRSYTRPEAPATIGYQIDSSPVQFAVIHPGKKIMLAEGANAGRKEVKIMLVDWGSMLDIGRLDVDHDGRILAPKDDEREAERRLLFIGDSLT